MPHFFIHSSVGGHWGCFVVWAVINNAAMNIYAQIFVGAYIFNSLGYIYKSRIAGSYGNYI